jgi:hypothetical protein
MPKKSSLSPRAGYKRAKGAVKKARRVASGVTRAATRPARAIGRAAVGAAKVATRPARTIGRAVGRALGPARAKRGKTNTGPTYEGRTAEQYATRSPGRSPVSMGTRGTRRGQTGASRTSVAKRSSQRSRRGK